MWSRWKKRQESVTKSSATLSAMKRLRTLQGHSMVVVGDVMYVDGGRYYTGDDFPKDEGKIFEFQNRANISDLWEENDLIFAFDMTKTLGPNSTTAEFLLPYTETIKKNDPATSGWGGQTHFNPIDKKSFIQVGGFPMDEKEPEVPFWSYGESSGFGNDFKIKDKKKAADLFNMYDATTAISPDGKLFMLGGVDYKNNAPKGGARLAMWDMKTGELNSWPANGGNLTVPRGANLRGGQMLWFPYGEKGILLSFGGVIWRGQENVPNSMKRIMVFDIASEKWFSQGASGGLSEDAFPRDRSHFCAAAPSPQENRTTYEIVFYGGLDAEKLDSAFDDVWSLTIPTFQWTKYYSFNDQAFGKYNRSCALVNDKYYGFVDYGSTDGGSLLSFWDITKNSDPNNGLDNGGWTRFDADNDEPYEPPLQVVTTIGSSDSPPEGWASGLDAVFNTTVYVTKDSSSFNATAPASESSPSASASAAAESSSSSTTGPIVGGVVGGVAVLALLGLLIFFLIRRKKQKQQDPHNNAYFNQQPQPPMAGPPTAELEQHGHTYQELDNSGKGVVDSTTTGGTRLPSPDSAPRVELYGSEPYQQMEGQNRHYPQGAGPGHFGTGPGGVPGSGSDVSPQSPTEMGVPELHGGERYSRTG